MNAGFLSIFLTLIIAATISYAEVPSSDIAERLVEYAHNKDNWPIVHYAIEKERPDVAVEALQLFPEQAVMLTPELKLMASHIGSDASGDYDYQVGTEQGISALELAVRKNYVNLTKLLLELGCNPSTSRTEYFGYMSDHWERRTGPFVYERVKFIDNYHKKTNYWTRSVLYWAIEANNAEVVNLLLKAGASLGGIKAQRNWRIDPSFDIERTCVHHAAFMASDEILQSLICYQTDTSLWEGQTLDPKILETFRAYVNNGSDWPPLHSALKNRDQEAFHVLLEHGEDVKWQGRAPDSLLNMAIASDDSYFLDLMIAYGLSSYEAIQEAVNQNKTEHVKKLLPLINPEEGVKILEQAALKGHTDIAILLISYGIFSNRTIELAIETNNVDLTSYLIQAKVVDFTQVKGLDTAIRQGMVDMVELLVKAKFQSSRSVEDKLLSLAIRSKNQRIFNIVEKAGYRDQDLWNAFVDADEIGMLHDYLQNKNHAQEITAVLSSMKKRAVEQGHTKMLAYLMAL